MRPIRETKRSLDFADESCVKRPRKLRHAVYCTNVSESALEMIDFSRADEPEPSGNQREDLVAWLDYQRHEFLRKLRDLSPTQLASWPVPPVELSVLGLVRHLRQMEHVYLAWGFDGGTRLDYYGDDDYAGGSADTVEDDISGYLAEIERSDAALAKQPAVSSTGLGHGQPLGFVLVKMIDEYALHSGQAHMIRFAALGRLLR